MLNTTPGPLPDLAHDYGLVADELLPHPGGFESDCWVADGAWFVKVWHTAAPPTRLDLLEELRAAGLPVPAPVPTRSGELYATWRGRPYAVFPFVSGRTAGDGDWRLAAQALKRVHALDGAGLPPSPMDEPEIQRLRERLDHPWIKDRAGELAEHIARLEQAIERARTKVVPQVLCHRDFGGLNLLIDDGRVVAILDWEQAVRGPREHDLWAAMEDGHGESFLAEYGARDLDLDHFEYALLARALRDLAARVLTETDRPGVDTWGFQRMARLDRDLAVCRPFCG